MDDDPDKTYGSCEGPNSVFIKLISSDGYEFIIKREYAMLSSTIRNMLNGPIEYAENEPTQINLSGISSNALVNVIKFLIHKASFKGIGLPDFPSNLDFNLDLLLAANFLEC